MNDRGHLSAETIDLLLLSSLSQDEADQVRAHLSDCHACKARWEELEQDKARFEQYVFPRTIARIEERARHRPVLEWFRIKWLVPLLAAAAAAAVALVVVPRTRTPSEDEPYVGVKGQGVGLEVVASRAEGGQFAVRTGARLRPGDRIRFVVDPGGAKYLLIASRDGRGNFTVYYPFGAEESASVGPGRQELPGSIELDDTVGPERLVALFSVEPIKADLVRTALERGEDVKAALKGQVSLEFVKDAP